MDPTSKRQKVQDKGDCEIVGYIENVHTGLVMGIEGNNPHKGFNIVTWTKDDNWDKKWVFTHDGKIKNKSTGLLMGIEGDHKRKGKRIVTWLDNGHWEKYWTMTSDGYIKSTKHPDNLVMGIEGDNDKKGGKIVTWSKDGNWDKIWKFVPVSVEGGLLYENDWIDGWHQTDEKSAEAICASNEFKPGSKGALGPGIYFATTAADTKGKAHSTGIMFQCRVSPGKVKVLSHWDPQWTEAKTRAAGYDTIFILASPAGDVATPEYKIYDKSRITIVKWYPC